MTTKNIFFNKIFSENEKAKDLYKDYDFSKISPEHIYLLNRLSIISKYKNSFKNFLLRKKISDGEKLEYIQSYKANLTYPEYIKYNVTVEENENSLINSLYVVGSVNLLSAIFLISRKGPNQSIFKEMSLVFLASILIGGGYIRYHKKSYKYSLNQLYETLEQRMNDNPELKMSIHNKNFVTEDIYDEGVDESL
jgi:hypothetical protein